MMEMPPLPKPELECWYGGSSDFHEEPMFDADQLRAYGSECARMAREEERERCAKMVEAAVVDPFTSGDPSYWLPDLAAAIRKG